MKKPPTAQPTIEGSRVRLRRLTGEDAPALFRIFSDPVVTRFWSSPPMKSIEDATRLLKEIGELSVKGELLQWGLTRKSNDKVIGTCTLAGIDRRHRRCELGFALHPEEWGHGFAREAVVALLGWAFRNLEMHRIEADVDPRNTPSIRLVKSLGFRREGLLRERYHMYGEIQDSLIFGLLRREYEERLSGA